MSVDFEDGFEYANNTAMHAVWSSSCAPAVTGIMDVSSAQHRNGAKSIKLTYPAPDSEGGCFMSRNLIQASDIFYFRVGCYLENFSNNTGVPTKMWLAAKNNSYPNFWFSIWSGGTLWSCAITNSLVGGQYNLIGVTSIPQGQWVCLEGEIRMNTPGIANGICRGWVNGTLSFDRTNLLLRGSSDNGNFNTPNSNVQFVQTYRQHGLGAIYYDDLAVSRDTRVTCGAVSTDTTPPPVPNAPAFDSVNLPAVATWAAVTNPGDLAGYKYYRKLEAAGGALPYTLIATLGNVLTYNDTTIPSDTTVISAKISSYDTSGNESALSAATDETLTPPAAYTLTPVFSDDFNRADAANLGTGWALITPNGTPDWSMKIVSNTARQGDIGAGKDSSQRCTSVLENDQYVEAVITIPATGSLFYAPGLLLRYNETTKNGYAVRILQQNGYTPKLSIQEWVNGSGATVASLNTFTWTSGHTLRFTAKGQDYKVWDVFNGVATKILELLGDPTYTGGFAGLISYSGTGTLTSETQFDNFVAGNVDSEAVVPDTFAHVDTVVTDANGADLTFLGLAHKIRYWDDLHAPAAATEVTGLGGVASYRLNTTWAAQISFACFEAQGSDGVWETTALPDSYVCANITPGTTDTTPPAVVTGLEIF